MTIQSEWLLVPVVLSVALWGWAFLRWAQGQPLIAWAPRRQAPWTILDIILLGFIGINVALATEISLQAATVGIDLEGLAGEDVPPLIRIAGFLLTSTVVGLVAIFVLRFRAGATLADLGLRPLQPGRDLLLSLAAFPMLAVPMLTVQFVATKYWPTEARHPFIDMIVANPEARTLMIIAVAAVVVAPLIEEFLFRVILQGWLERLIDSLFPTAQITIECDDPEAPQDVASNLDDALAGDGEHPDVASCEPNESIAPVTELVESSSTRWIPILISGTLFGLAHFDHGPAPIALSFLGIGLGYLYQRTHRVLPCILVHAFVNLLAVVQLAAYIVSGQPVTP